jgi:VanZ family protein
MACAAAMTTAAIAKRTASRESDSAPLAKAHVCSGPRVAKHAADTTTAMRDVLRATHVPFDRRPVRHTVALGPRGVNVAALGTGARLLTMSKNSRGSDDAPRSPTVRDRVVRWAPVGVWMCAIFAVSSLSGSSIPGPYSFQGHFAEYAVLGALVMAALRTRPATFTWVLVAVAACSVYGVTDEVHQAFVPGRTPDVLDWAMDTVGAIAGAGGVALWLARRARRRASAR